MVGVGVVGVSGGVSFKRHWRASIYSTAWFKMFTLDIFLTGAALGMCFFNISNPLLTVFTRFLSLAFLRDTLTSCGGGMAYP